MLVCHGYGYSDLKKVLYNMNVTAVGQLRECLLNFSDNGRAGWLIQPLPSCSSIFHILSDARPSHMGGTMA